MHSSKQSDFVRDFEGKTSMAESAFEGKRSIREKSHKVQLEVMHSSKQSDFERDFEGKTSMVESAFEGNKNMLGGSMLEQRFRAPSGY